MEPNLTEPIAYRPAWSNVDESLLVPHNVFEVLLRERSFADATGLIIDRDYTLPPVSTYPLPIYPEEWPVVNGVRRKRWENLPADLAWHPLFWLPEHLRKHAAVDYVTDIDDTDHYEETENQYAIRVALEVSKSGLYDQATGTWVDVLHLYGLNVDESDDRKRVQAWLDGGDDPILDQIDLTTMFSPDKLSAVSAAEEVSGLVERGSAVLAAMNLADELKPVLEPGTSHNEAVEILETVCYLAAQHLSGTSQNAAQFWAVCANQVSNCDPRTLRELAQKMSQELASVVAANYDALGALAEFNE